jgi:pyruvate formate lyase activating enzyme
LSSSTTGIVFDIQKFSLHDGPGIRTLVLLKGCALRCRWCCNPESQSVRTQVVFFDRKCIRRNGFDCRECAAACPGHGIEVAEGTIARDQARCDACDAYEACTNACPAGALVPIGRRMTVAEVFAQVEQDTVFYRNSGGGVTLSGGEPLMQAEFAAALLERCRAGGLPTAMETCGYARWESVARVLPFLDLVLYDIKHVDPAAHRTLTGVSNELILDNARRIAAAGVPLSVRVPVIPGLNDSESNIRATAELARELGARRVHLLPYHRLGLAKYHRLQVVYRLEDLKAPAAAHMQALRAWVQSYGLDVQIGG